LAREAACLNLPCRYGFTEIFRFTAPSVARVTKNRFFQSSPRNECILEILGELEKIRELPVRVGSAVDQAESIQ
jgi:hypothetical protein